VLRLVVLITSLVVPRNALAQGPTAGAETGWGAVVLSFGGDGEAVMNAEARDGVTAGLVAEGFSVLDEAEVSARIPPARLREAASIDALRAIAVELGAESLATVAVWTSDGAADSIVVSLAPATGGRSFSATEAVEAAGVGAAAQGALRGALRRRTRAAMLEGGTGSVATETEAVLVAEEAARVDEGDPWAEDDPRADGGPESLFGIIGPGLLLAIGGAGIGLGIYAVLGENCTQRAPLSGDCLRGDAPNTAVGILLVVGGVISAAGSAVWWVTGAATTSEPPVDGVVWNDGGMLRVRGRF
jgi:hypothetical protein